MATIKAPDLSTAAKASADKNTAEVEDAFGHAANGLTHMFEDPTIPQHQKTPFFRAIGDMGFSGIQRAFTTLTGQQGSQLAINGGTSPDPITAPPAPTPGPTPNDAKIKSLEDKIAEVTKFITDNGAMLVGDDLVAGLNAVVSRKEAAATTKAAATAPKPTDPNAAVTKLKADLKPIIADISKALGTAKKSAKVIGNDLVITPEEKTKADDKIKEAKQLLG